jgi:hypothetical protein
VIGWLGAVVIIGGHVDIVFSQIGITAMDFVQIWAGFILTMVIFFGVKGRRYSWLNYFMLLVFSLQCLIIALFHDGLPVKLFVGLMLISVLTVESVVIRKRRLHEQGI